jgi:hypothetical protein
LTAPANHGETFDCRAAAVGWRPTIDDVGARDRSIEPGQKLVHRDIQERDVSDVTLGAKYMAHLDDDRIIALFA